MKTIRPGRPRPPSAAFTLVEILLILSLLTLAIAVLLPAAGALLRGAHGETAEDSVFAMMQDARRQAVLSGREVALRYDPGLQDLIWSDGRQSGRRTIEDGKATVEFLRPGSGAILLGGELVETNPVKEMKFYADGTCDLISLQLRFTDRAPRVIAIDPWTCAPVLVPGS
jgi:type II secretory pathway pseudopilin PulG